MDILFNSNDYRTYNEESNAQDDDRIIGALTFGGLFPRYGYGRWHRRYPYYRRYWYRRPYYPYPYYPFYPYPYPYTPYYPWF